MEEGYGSFTKRTERLREESKKTASEKENENLEDMENKPHCALCNINSIAHAKTLAERLRTNKIYYPLKYQSLDVPKETLIHWLEVIALLNEWGSQITILTGCLGNLFQKNIQPSEQDAEFLRSRLTDIKKLVNYLPHEDWSIFPEPVQQAMREYLKTFNDSHSELLQELKGQNTESQLVAMQKIYNALAGADHEIRHALLGKD